MLHKTAILVKPCDVLQRKCSLVFPLMSYNSVGLLPVFSEAVPNNDPLLQLQLQSAGSLHVAFRNLRESQSRGRAVEEHQRENQRTFSL